MNKRELKFRAFFPKEHWVTEKYGQMIEDYAYTQLFECFGFWDEEVIYMQFTGLYDKNGKEIYEGDVVFVENGDYDVRCVCEFSTGQFNLVDGNGGFWTRQLYHEPERLTVNGNVFEDKHQNKELINETTDTESN